MDSIGTFAEILIPPKLEDPQRALNNGKGNSVALLYCETSFLLPISNKNVT